MAAAVVACVVSCRRTRRKCSRGGGCDVEWSRAIEEALEGRAEDGRRRIDGVMREKARAVYESELTTFVSRSGKEIERLFRN